MTGWCLQTTIECCVDVNTTDGYKLRLFCIAFTKRRQNQLKKTTYAQTAQIKQIRKKMTDIMTKEASCVAISVPCLFCVFVCARLELEQTAGFFPAFLTHHHSRTVDLKDLVKKFIPNSIGTQIEQVRTLLRTPAYVVFPHTVWMICTWRSSREMVPPHPAAC
jgi:hypothetical protein